MIADAFAGPGGWSEGLRFLGLIDVGIEWGAAECATRAAAGHLTIRADVAAYPAEVFAGKLEGFICSSPCPDFSKAGKRAGLGGLTGTLVFETLRWAEAARPRWIAAENVDEVAPIFRSFRAPLVALGYSVWSGVLDAADFGVPQNRRRAFLLASLDRKVVPPVPSHSRSGAAEMFGDGRLPWISMAEALGWGYEDRSARTVCGDRMPRWLYPDRDGSHGEIVVRPGNNSQQAGGRQKRYERSIDRPAPTIDTKAGRTWRVDTRHGDVPVFDAAAQPARTVSSTVARGSWVLRHPGRSYDAEPATRPVAEPAPCIALGHNAAEWCWERPATCVQGTPRIAPPGYRGGKAAMARGNKERQFDEGSGAVKVELWELGVLQGFAADYPWRGNKTEQARQIGNAVPPPMAAALVAAVTGRALREVAA